MASEAGHARVDVRSFLAGVAIEIPLTLIALQGLQRGQDQGGRVVAVGLTWITQVVGSGRAEEAGSALGPPDGLRGDAP